MKHLMLMRHAKSSWGNASLPDFQRPLNDRGEADALHIGEELVKRKAVPEKVVTSTAVRALETVSRVSRAFGKDFGDKIDLESQLYAASSGRILEAAKDQRDNLKRVLIVAHNPGMEELVARLTGSWLSDGMKTATVACITFECAHWADIEDNAGTLEWVLYPRDIDLKE